MASCGSSLFGNGAQYIKVSGGDFIAVDGANIVDRLTVSDLRMPYKQLLKSRIILRPGQENYLLNHLGLGDNATFLAIKAIYNPKSVIEEDNYIKWSFYDDLTRVNTMAQMMCLTGNSTNRIKQLYLTNPNTKYPVTLEVMVGVIDDTYTFFGDFINQIGTSFTGLEYTDIQTYTVGESIVINDKNTPVRPLVFILLNNINSIDISGRVLTIDDSSHGTILLQFLTEYDANQANSLLNYLLEFPNLDISNIPVGDDVRPVIYFNDRVGGTGEIISLNGATASPYNTNNGLTFSTSISLSTYGTASGTVIDKELLIDLLIDYIDDNRDGIINIGDFNLTIKNTLGTIINSIITTGTYTITFDFSDIAGNNLDNVNITIVITT